MRDVMEQRMAEHDGGEQDAGAKYDVDLTILSSTMVYAEVFNMMIEPESYAGKRVRASGQFAILQATDFFGDPIPEPIYFACLIADASACCSQGLEFVLADERSYPDGYPEPGADIVVSGVFETYEEDGARYCRLADAILE